MLKVIETSCYVLRRGYDFLRKKTTSSTDFIIFSSSYWLEKVRNPGKSQEYFTIRLITFFIDVQSGFIVPIQKAYKCGNLEIFF